MSRFVRRSLVLAVLVVVALPLSATASGAQQESDLTIAVRKVVVGPGAPSAVTVSCEGNDQVSALVGIDFVLDFDAQGHPAGPAGVFAIEDGAWVLHGHAGGGGHCTFTETATGGAASTAWTCDYTFTPVEVPEATQIQQAGCQATSGAGVGPATVVNPGDADVSEQASTVVFTNTFVSAPPIQPAPAVVVQPAYTG
jgi:hypothetical protein